MSSYLKPCLCLAGYLCAHLHDLLRTYIIYSPFRVLIGWKQQLSLGQDCKLIQAHVGEYVQMTMWLRALCFLMSGVHVILHNSPHYHCWRFGILLSVYDLQSCDINVWAWLTVSVVCEKSIMNASLPVRSPYHITDVFPSSMFVWKCLLKNTNTIKWRQYILWYELKLRQIYGVSSSLLKTKIWLVHTILHFLDMFKINYHGAFPVQFSSPMNTNV